MKPLKPVIWNRNTNVVCAALLAAPWADAILIYMLGDNISFKCTLFFLETDIASILWMCKLQSLCAFETCKEFCNLLLNIISLILQPNIQHVKTWKQTVRASQLNITLCLLRYEYWLADKLLLSNNTLRQQEDVFLPPCPRRGDGLQLCISHLHGCWGLKPLRRHPEKYRLGNPS